MADRVTQIDAGYAHTLLMSEKGDVWTFGCGLFGQMGNGDNKKVGLPITVCFKTFPLKYPIPFQRLQGLSRSMGCPSR